MIWHSPSSSCTYGIGWRIELVCGTLNCVRCFLFFPLFHQTYGILVTWTKTIIKLKMCPLDQWGKEHYAAALFLKQLSEP